MRDAMGPGRHDKLELMQAQASPARESSIPSVDSVRGDAPLEREIASRAYAIWLGRGRLEGTDREDWFEAERQLREERCGTPAPTIATIAEQAREAREAESARNALASNRERMVDIGRGNQQAGRQRQ
jgi:hypothetical protein